MTALLRLRDSDRGRPVTDLVTRFAYNELTEDARAVLRDLTPIEREVHIQEDNGPIFLLRIRPYRTVDNVIDGVIMTFVDISGRRRAASRRKNPRDEE
jgi:two-component system CheB/CheR fusion protein